MIAQIIMYGVIIGIFYALVAVGLSLLFGVMKYMNIAHGSFVVIGGYISFWLFNLLGIDPFLSIPFVLVIMFVIGLIVYGLVFSPLKRFAEGQRLGNSMLITFGLILVLDNLVAFLWTSDVKTITAPYSGQVIQLLGIRVPFTSLGVIGVTFAIIGILHLFLSRTYIGQSIKATAQDWEAASLLGININRTYLIACGISVALAGAAGTAVVLMYSISPYSGLEWMLISMIVLVFAGLGKIREVFLAGLALGLLEQLGVFLLGGHYRAVVGLVLFVLILILRPQGLFAK
ncbi:MAG: branched-chain amino acid ABC transporter permease [Spirochaetes bacterium]|nr:branched-chain amino acid ABC transporter permease [Spirochaetota bacterium]